MAVMSQEVKDLFTKVSDVVFSTASAGAQPNACIVGMKFVIDDETIYLSDQFFSKTLGNINENDKVAVVFWEGHDAFQIHGTASYVNEGEQFEALAAKVNATFEAKGMPIRSKGGVFVHVDAVYSSAPGPQAGAQLA
ncbi:MAG: pyridoxamine 5'-phosphate oxidase family protein [Coriobacteriales bacterium]